MKDEDLAVWSAVEMRQAIGNKEVSPVEVLEACIARIAAVNPYVNAMAACCLARARVEAKEAEAAVLRGEPLGLLHGLPVGVKDLEPTEGLLTTYGSPLFRGNIPAADGAVPRALRREGGIVVCKTNVPEYGAGANTRNDVWGATGNPFAPELICGGSSGGSAVALATDMLPVCSGSDTGGSLRIPAAYCGVVGYRPSPGLVPVERRSLGWTPISVSGPMGRTVGDTALQMAALAGFDTADPLSAPVDGHAFLGLQPADLGGLRVAYTEDFGSPNAPVSEVDHGIREAFREKIAAMRHLFRCCDEIHPAFTQADRCFDVVRAAGFVAQHAQAYERDPGSLGPNTRFNYELGASMTLADHVNAHVAQTELFRAFQAIYHDYDVILTPATSVSPFPWTQLAMMEINGKPLENYYRWLSLTYVVTLATNPAFSLPCGRDHKNMPFGMQVVGGFRQDSHLFGIALALESAWSRIDGLGRPRPEIRDLTDRPAPDFKSMVSAPPEPALAGL
ncbi:amidase [Allopusillimonas soli]|uniref:Amidase n=1 Tax=Allopusillimonas soli TaxID=659016 RepID=A0A853FCJ8_9BURK|nr:amidase family protein [Allopusillimonas soli]NYT37478.1 amidase [Allopusillimonas soli]TEA74873.1 amidase [Allopusillimonas soli]